MIAVTKVSVEKFSKPTLRNEILFRIHAKSYFDSNFPLKMIRKLLVVFKIILIC